MNNRELSAHLCALGQALQIPYAHLPLTDISSKLTKARKTLNKVQMNAAVIRDKYLEELAQLNITGNQTDTATIIKNIRHCEEIKQSNLQGETGRNCLIHPCPG
eukprot:958814-Ditylum_brightwellii.AAC.1